MPMQTFDHTVDLIDITSTANDLGDSITTETATTVFCDRRSVSRSEHYAAMQNGNKPEIVLIVNKYDYSDQGYVDFQEKRYRVSRSYLAPRSNNFGSIDNLELICEGVDH